jgi:sulfur-oxidizing protein SoxY
VHQSRRTILTATVSAAVTAFFSQRSAIANTVQLEEAISQFSEGQRIEDETVALKVPEIAEDGNSVPVSVFVNSPMTEYDYVESVVLLSTGNQQPNVVTFHFTPLSGFANAVTNIRLEKTQDVIALARLSNGRIFKSSKTVKVALGGLTDW